MLMLSGLHAPPCGCFLARCVCGFPLLFLRQGLAVLPRLTLNSWDQLISHLSLPGIWDSGSTTLPGFLDIFVWLFFHMNFSIYLPNSIR